LQIKIFSRGKGRSAVAAAAYRAAEIIKSKYDGITHDFTRKSGVLHTEIMLPERAPPDYTNRAILWNSVEMSETNSNAQLAREVEVSLPRELAWEQNLSLVRDFVKHTFVDKGMCADVCVHDKGDGNPHAHIMLTLRPLNDDGTWAAKSKKEYILDKNDERIRLPSGEYKSRKVSAVDWNDKGKAEIWRAAWEEYQNAHLESGGHSARVDHRSYARQGIEKKPTVHLGAAASQMEKRGIATDRGNINRAVAVSNQQIGQLRARIRKVKEWLYAQPLTDAPTMVDIMNNIAATRNTQTHWQRIRDLQTKAKVLVFLQKYKVSDMGQLLGSVEKIFNDFKNASEEIRKVDRRMDTLKTHLAQVEIRRKRKKVYEHYNQLKGKKSDAFYDKHFAEIQEYEKARDYIKAVLNGRTDIPVKKWEAELAKLTATRYTLFEDYYRLRDDTRNIELIRKGAENIMREDDSRTQPQRVLGHEI